MPLCCPTARFGLDPTSCDRRTWTTAEPGAGARRSFPDSAFSLFEVDPALAQGRIFEFCEVFRECARQ